jgi:pilus assembly protein CpaB
VRIQSIAAVALALVFGGSAAVGVNSFLRNRGEAASVETVPVLIAAMDVPRGGTITAELVSVKNFPREMAPAGSLAKPEEAIDRAVAVPLVRGEPVLDAKLSKKGAGRGLSALVPPGMRAVTINTPNLASGVAGFVLPGNKVDVLLTVSDNNTTSGGGVDTGGGSTTTLMQNVEILAVDQKMDAPAENKVDPRDLRSVTLLVTPHQANLLDLGQNKGTLHLSLRNHNDNQATNIPPATLADVRFRHEKPWDEKVKGVLAALGEAMAKRAAAMPPPPPPVVKAPEPPPKMIIRTIRGAHEGEVAIVKTDTGGR